MLDRADRRFALPPDVRNYLTSHFRMVREENESLRRELDRHEDRAGSMKEEHRLEKTRR